MSTSGEPRLASRLARVIATVIAVATLWLGGFLHFVRGLPTVPGDLGPPHDGIVVLTGGPLRLPAGLDLLNAGAAKRLFVSGVNPGVTASMLPGHAENSELFDCCVDLGFAATDTATNAVETAAWASMHRARQLIVVTAAWHLPRAMVELRRRLPEAVLTPWPIQSERMPLDRWWAAPGTFATLALEFNKYVVALVRARANATLTTNWTPQ